MICTRCHRQDGTHEPGCGEPEAELEPLADGKFRDLSHLYAEESVEPTWDDTLAMTPEAPAQEKEDD